MRICKEALAVLILSLAFGPDSAALAYVSPPPSSKASARKRNGDIISHDRVSPLKNSLGGGNVDGFRQAEDEARTSSSSFAQNNPTSPRSNVEQVSEVIASAAPSNDDAARLTKEVEASAKELKAQQEQLERLRAQRDEILQEFAGPVAAAWLTPLAALGAGRAFLQGRETVQAEVEAAKVELAAKRAELERKERELGRAVSSTSGGQRRPADGTPRRNMLNVSRSTVRCILFKSLSALVLDHISKFFFLLILQFLFYCSSANSHCRYRNRRPWGYDGRCWCTAGSAGCSFSADQCNFVIDYHYLLSKSDENPTRAGGRAGSREETPGGQRYP